MRKGLFAVFAAALITFALVEVVAARPNRSHLNDFTTMRRSAALRRNTSWREGFLDRSAAAIMIRPSQAASSIRHRIAHGREDVITAPSPNPGTRGSS